MRPEGQKHPTQRVHGQPVIAPSDRGRVVASRSVMMPDGTSLVCRQRATSNGKTHWTAEVPIEIALEIYND